MQGKSSDCKSNFGMTLLCSMGWAIMTQNVTRQVTMRVFFSVWYVSQFKLPRAAANEKNQFEQKCYFAESV